jgi:hypothetical protein
MNARSSGLPQSFSLLGHWPVPCASGSTAPGQRGPAAGAGETTTRWTTRPNSHLTVYKTRTLALVRDVR